jgi:hypothetical protein
MKLMKRVVSLAVAAQVTMILMGAVGPVTAAQAQAAPSVTVDATGTFDARTGSAILTGTFACGDAEGFAFVEVNLSQTVGRVSTVFGSAFADIPPCTPGASGTWTATISPSNGEFRGGPATASARLVVDDAGIAETTSTVRLRG